MSRLSIVRCEEYRQEIVFKAVKRSLDLLGGLETFVKPGMKVLLKPNLLSARPPEDAVDTHPEVVRAVSRLVKECHAAPLIGDSPGGYGKNVLNVFEVSGMKDMAEEEGVELVKFTNSRLVDKIPIARHVFASDFVISIPKLKTHSITVLTAAIKNSFGAVTGVHKAECHSMAPQVEDFAKIIAKIHSLVRPHLIILDGILAMEGDGPSSGSPRKMNFVMAGTDAVAIDSCVSKIIGLEPADIDVTTASADLGLGEMNLAKIEVMGDKIEDFIAPDFRLAQTTPLKLLPKAVARSIAKLVRFKPFIDSAKCRRCNLCKTGCPVDAINFFRNKYYRINYKKCIRCLCCHELCPYKAISIKRNFLTKLIWG